MQTFLLFVVKNKILLSGLLLLVISFVIQGASVYFLGSGFLKNALILHGVSACLFPFALYLLLPVQYRPETIIFSFLFLMCLLIPVVSGLGLLLSLSVSLYYAKSIDKNITETIDTDLLPDNIIETVQLTAYEGGSLLGILESSSVEEQRIQAVLKTRNMTDEDAIPILRVALLDPVDEVRLLAYSMLDKKGKYIDHTISLNLAKLKEQSVNASRVHLNLAESYWEQSYLGLVSGQAKECALKDAYKHILLALEGDTENSSSYFLQARIALALNDYPLAKYSFEQALALGIPVDRIAPYQAELAFMTGQFDQIKRYIADMDTTVKNNNVISGIVKQWG